MTTSWPEPNDVVGVDVSDAMLAQARMRDPAGQNFQVDEAGFTTLRVGGFDLVLSAFTFDNMPTDRAKLRALRKLRERLVGEGCLVNLVSTPDIYVHEWVSLSTKDFPENRDAGNGDPSTTS